MGGFVPQRSYLLRGLGTGKTGIGMHFLVEGVKQGETVLFINMGEPTDQVIENARVMGFNTEGIDFWI